MDNLNYGIVGNCRSAALISDKGSIDWCCLPEFNSSSFFAKILDVDKGGSFEFLVDGSYKISQSYIRKTNILVTKFENGEDAFEVVDFMPRYLNDSRGYYAPPDLIRYIKHISGKPSFRLKYDPRLEYAQYTTKTIVTGEYIKSFTTKGVYDSAYLYTDLDKEKVVKGEYIELVSDAFFLFSYNQKILKQTLDRAYLKLQRTKVYWLNWTERTKIFVKYNEEILRSALVLKLLSYDKSGAVLAAVTTSLPETIGEIRNWDYRFCWLRDSSMVIKVMSYLGHQNVASRYLNFIIDIIPDKDEKIQIMYGINRDKKLTEKVLGHLSGYMNSAPVRIGNDAYRQKQNDIYGILMDVIYQQFSIFETSLEHSEALWTITRSVVKIVKANWQKPDRGIWEIRTEHKHFTFSKVLCWVAVDRAIKIAQLIRKNEYVKDWKKLADKIRNEIMQNAWNDKLKAFTQYYGSNDLDASTLLMDSYGFIDPKDPRFVSTVKATEKNLCRDGLMYRYKNADDFGLPSSSFTICTFWLIESLYNIGEKDKAVDMFDQVLKYSNHLGLYSEDIDFKTKRLLGNFPQAYSHLALIETAIKISGGSVTANGKLLEFFQG
ncbi:MAG: glycoside hydrolase family 15 protein [Bacteroidales bacterium]|nr:glycoside hydrolase family 15 protein [Bacteroidales bacterium]